MQLCAPAAASSGDLMTVPMLVAVAAALKLSLIPSVVMTAMSFLVYGVEPSTNAMSMRSKRGPLCARFRYATSMMS